MENLNSVYEFVCIYQNQLQLFEYTAAETLNTHRVYMHQKSQWMLENILGNHHENNQSEVNLIFGELTKSTNKLNSLLTTPISKKIFEFQSTEEQSNNKLEERSTENYKIVVTPCENQKIFQKVQSPQPPPPPPLLPKNAFFIIDKDEQKIINKPRVSVTTSSSPFCTKLKRLYTDNCKVQECWTLWNKPINSSQKQQYQQEEPPYIQPYQIMLKESELKDSRINIISKFCKK